MDLLYSMVPLALGVATPIIISSLGGLFSERSGIVNIALEGIMLVGAFAGATSSILLEGSLGALAPWVGILIGAFFGMLFSLIHAFASIHLKSRSNNFRYCFEYAFYRINCLFVSDYF